MGGNFKNKDSIQGVTNIIIAFGIVFGIRAYKTTQKQLFINTISRCVEAFKKIENLSCKSIEDKTIKLFVELVNEELFYFQNGYLPLNVADEWIDGMIDYLPFYDYKRILLNPGNCIKKLADDHDDFLKNYPRIINAMGLKGKYNWEEVYGRDPILRRLQRAKIIIEILTNLKALKWYNWRKRMRIAKG